MHAVQYTIPKLDISFKLKRLDDLGQILTSEVIQQNIQFYEMNILRTHALTTECLLSSTMKR